MRLFSSIPVVLLGLLGSAVAKSASGDRLLVVLEESTDKALYSQLWADLEGKQEIQIYVAFHQKS